MMYSFIAFPQRETVCLKFLNNDIGCNAFCSYSIQIITFKGSDA